MKQALIGSGDSDALQTGSDVLQTGTDGLQTGSVEPNKSYKQPYTGPVRQDMGSFGHKAGSLGLETSFERLDLGSKRL